jgi:hypothetical protein
VIKATLKAVEPRSMHWSGNDRKKQLSNYASSFSRVLPMVETFEGRTIGP